MTLLLESLRLAGDGTRTGEREPDGTGWCCSGDSRCDQYNRKRAALHRVLQRGPNADRDGAGRPYGSIRTILPSRPNSTIADSPTWNLSPESVATGNSVLNDKVLASNLPVLSL